jgi:NitT/TauT family transport system substrate-binding protein
LREVCFLVYQKFDFSKGIELPMSRFVRARFQRLFSVFVLGLFGVVATCFSASSVVRAEVTEVRIGIQFGLIYLPVMVAEAKGFFAEEAAKAGLGQLKVIVQRFSGSPAINDALLSGSVDAGAYGLPGLLIAWDKTKERQEVKGLAALSANPYILFTNKPEIKSLTDFGEQDRIALPATIAPQAILLRLAAEKAYGPGQFGRLDTVMIGMPHPEAMAALLAGKTGITGYFASPPFSTALLRENKVHAVITSGDILDGEEVSSVVFGARKAFVDANPIVAKTILAAIEDAMAFIAKDPNAAVEIYLAAEPVKIAKEDVLRPLSSMGYGLEPRNLMKFARLMRRAGMIKNEPSSWKDVFFPLLHDRNGS